jgi:hypothetical protein
LTGVDFPERSSQTKVSKYGGSMDPGAKTKDPLAETLNWAAPVVRPADPPYIE